ncbi:uncharacterized protein LOC122324468 [Scomber scombrus]|uniref:Uncharacterized protein LOC122324468 n=1 Tax=Scomber scombrus TaxID=13677 RepID=A0AAV1Q9A5_SCOSC
MREENLPLLLLLCRHATFKLSARGSLNNMGKLRQGLTELLRARNTLVNRRKIVLWMQKKGILKRQMMCKSCDTPMTALQVSRQDDFHWISVFVMDTWGGGRSVSVRQGSMFYKSRRFLQDHLEFIYRFSQGLRMRQVDLIEDGVAASSRTLTKMASSLRKVCRRAIHKLRIQGKMNVGGHHYFVILEESKF